MQELYIRCPRCLAQDIDTNAHLLLITVDFDELNSEGSLEFVCSHCKTKFTTGLIHLEESSTFYGRCPKCGGTGVIVIVAS